MEKLLKALEDFIHHEYMSTVRALKNGWGGEDMVRGSLQRCLGATQFLMTLGVPYEKASAIYDTYREEFYKLF